MQINVKENYCKKSGELPLNSNVADYDKNVKNYFLKDSLPPCELGSVPYYEDDPLTGVVKFSWQKVETPYSQRFHDGGKTSGKLFRCGLAWRHVTYYDEQQNPVFFPYGYKAETIPEDDVDDPLERWYKEYDARQFLRQAGCMLGDNTIPVSTVINADAPDNTPEFLAQERERDKGRRKHTQKQGCKDLVNANYLNYMYTLTFALELNENVYGLRFVLAEDEQRKREKVEKAWNTRRTVIQKHFKTQDIDFKYVKVLEPHNSKNTDDRKRHTYHIHLATDRLIDKHLLQDLWGYGVVWVDDFNKAKTTDNDGNTVNVKRDGCVLSPGDYMSKYMEKDFDTVDALGKRAYSPSQNLQRVTPDRDTLARQGYLQHPVSGFSDFDKTHIEQVEGGLFAKIEALNSIDKVKVFDKWVNVEYERNDRETGELETVKLWIHYEYYNFRLLMNNARERRKPEHPRNMSQKEGKNAHGKMQTVSLGR